MSDEGSMIDFIPGRYFAGIWCVALPPESFTGAVKLAPNKAVMYSGGDWLAVLWRAEATPRRWHLQARTRYHVDDKFFGSDDLKGDYSHNLIVADELRAQKLVERMALEKAGGVAREVVAYPLHCNSEQAIERITANPPSFMRFALVTVDADGAVEAEEEIAASAVPAIVKTQRAVQRKSGEAKT